MPCIILYQPLIPQNTGNIIRLCANCGFDLHLIQPLGFSLDEKAVQRAGMDYRELMYLKQHDSLDACLASLDQFRLVLASTKGSMCYSDFVFSAQDALLFGNESYGLPANIWDQNRYCPSLHLPMQKGSRSMNLSNAVAILCYECWRQLAFVCYV